MISSYIYSSQTNDEIETESLRDIQTIAKRENLAHSITGYLTYKKETFIQYIEGPEKEIEQLIKNLHNDKRHTILKSIHFPPKTERVFKDWSMRYIEYGELIEIGFHELLETVFFTVDNKIFEEDRVIEKLNQMLEKIATTQKNIK
ncbi:BLUF domain-containing protein [Flammeovirga sp. EKP202]|uniref:BLUF domain-containing protein n=1 Tax=Flammeovirga sp. EKP202 TaxID=2770592 RepID=UPI00165FE934|nr:BLUF domain-containing protein [Flammeovirga sp. EKP202]MBD0403415.1 BLUF domain-containing protein [Flammeovirga sp. EKP202]